MTEKRLSAKRSYAMCSRSTIWTLPVADIVPLAANAAFPLAVVDEEKVFRGIITKASVLSSFVA